MSDQVFISGPGFVAHVLPNEYVVIYAPPGTSMSEAIQNPGDNPRMSVADLYDQLVIDAPVEDPPSFDVVESVGFDGTGRNEPTGTVTWKQVAERLLETHLGLPDIDKRRDAGLPTDPMYRFTWKDVADAFEEQANNAHEKLERIHDMTRIS